MQISKRTPRSEMQAKSLWKRTDGLAEQMAAALQAPVEDIKTELNTFIYLSVNVQFENGDVEWQPACASDDDPALVAKFLRYMDSDIEAINAASTLVLQRDQPFDPALGPEPPGETEKNS